MLPCFVTPFSVIFFATHDTCFHAADIIAFDAVAAMLTLCLYAFRLRHLLIFMLVLMLMLSPLILIAAGLLCCLRHATRPLRAAMPAPPMLLLLPFADTCRRQRYASPQPRHTTLTAIIDFLPAIFRHAAFRFMLLLPY